MLNLQEFNCKNLKIKNFKDNMIEDACSTTPTQGNIISLYNSGLSQKEVAHCLKVSEGTISYTLNKFNIPRRKVLKKIKVYTNISDDIIKDYLNNESSLKLSKKYKISKFSILKCLKENNITIRENNGDLQRKYDLNHNYFNEIDTENKAYILGFIFADGYVDQVNNRLSISIVEKDVEILNFINTELESNYNIYFKNWNNRQNVVTLTITSRQIVKDLVNVGCVQAKTFVTKFPNIREDLKRHFIRGYFDGDGYVSKTDNRIEIVGTEELLTEMATIFHKETGFTYSKLRTRHPERNNNIRILIYYGKNKFEAFSNFIYPNTESFGLERKKQKICKSRKD